MSRQFDGVGDVIVLDEGALDSFLNGSFTIVVGFKRLGSTTDGAQFLIGIYASGVLVGGVWISSSGELTLTITGSSRTFGLTVSDNNWYAAVIRKANGTQTPDANLYDYTANSWAGWSAGSGTLDNNSSTITDITLGGLTSGNSLNGRKIGAACYSSVLSNAVGETLEASAQDWRAASPVGMWLLNQASTSTPVTDDTAGGADETALTGTTVSADEPDDWSYAGNVEGALTVTAPAAASAAQGVLAAEGILSSGAPAAAASLAGTAPIVGVVSVTAPAGQAALTGASSAVHLSRLLAMPTTTVSVYAPSQAPDEWSGARTDDILIVGGVPASLIEQARTVNDPRSGTPRVIRQVTGRVPNGTPVTPNSRLVDGEGRRYAVGSVRQARNPMWVGDVVLELVRLAQESP